MTKIGADASLGLLQSQSGLTLFKAGAELVANVKGPTRHGLIVQVGTDSFLLNARAALQDAKSLTLHITETPKGLDHKVQIMAADSRPLAKPIQGELTPRLPVSATEGASPPMTEEQTATEGRQIQVHARPVARDGRYLGPPVTMRLELAPPSTSSSGGAEVSQTDKGVAASSAQVSASQDAATTGKLEAEPSSRRAVPPALIQPAPPSPSPSKEERSAFNLHPKAPLTPLLAGAQAKSATLPQQISGIPANPALPAGVTSPPEGPARHAPTVPGSGISPLALEIDKTPTNVNPLTKVNPLHPEGSRGDHQDLTRATVVGRSSDNGRLLLRVANDLVMKVEQPIDLPIGTTLQMTLMTTPINPGQMPNSDAQMSQAGLLTRIVELLEDIEQSGRIPGESREPAAARQLPMPDRQLAARLLRLIGFQMSASFEEAGMVAPDQENGDISKTRQLQGLLVDVANRASEPLGDGWRSTALPLGPDPAQALMIHFREHYLDDESHGDEAGPDDALAQRAVFEINFSRLGRCQIDVLCQEQRFDLLLRSERPLSHRYQHEITDLYLSACEIAGLTGRDRLSRWRFRPAGIDLNSRQDRDDLVS